MTIKEWLYMHKNFTLIILVCLTFIQFKAWYDSLIDQRWGWLGFFTLTSAVMISYTLKWWENEQ